MVERLTEDEWERIEAFAKTPAYDRQPEILLPEDAKIGDELDDGSEKRSEQPLIPVPGER